MTVIPLHRLRYDAPAGTTGAGVLLSEREIECRLREGLMGTGPYTGPNKTRSKIFKMRVVELLGYPVPESFGRGLEALPAQNLDIFVQQSNNCQPWNNKLLPDRRYVMIRPDADGWVIGVRVVRGSELIALDKTRKITTKLQASVDPHISALQLVNIKDTDALTPFLGTGVDLTYKNPVNAPEPGSLLPIRSVARSLFDLVGESFKDPGPGCDRERGEILHRMVLASLGYAAHGDNGQLPDIPHQLIETKLQLRGTIDLGQHDPSSGNLLDGRLGEMGFAPRDLRYVVASADLVDGQVTITRIAIVSGAWFSTRFEMYGGRSTNGKAQIYLPEDFFSAAA